MGQNGQINYYMVFIKSDPQVKSIPYDHASGFNITYDAISAINRFKC